MKKNYKFIVIDFLKELRDNTNDESFRRRYGAVIESTLKKVNLIDYLIYEKEFYK